MHVYFYMPEGESFWNRSPFLQPVERRGLVKIAKERRSLHQDPLLRAGTVKKTAGKAAVGA